jgi:hypothetical protein
LFRAGGAPSCCITPPATGFADADHAVVKARFFFASAQHEDGVTNF